MTTGEIVVAIVVAFLGVVGTSIGSVLAYMQFAAKRKDEKEEKSIQKQIDDSIDKAMGRFIAQCGEIGDAQIKKAKEEMHGEIAKGLEKRGKEGLERFNINSEQIQKNTEQIAELTGLVKDQVVKLNGLTDSMVSLNKVVSASAESQKSSNYDRLLFLANKVLKSGKMTISDKTNIKQHYNSWKELGGNDPKIDTYYEECMKMTPVPDENY